MTELVLAALIGAVAGVAGMLMTLWMLVLVLRKVEVRVEVKQYRPVESEGGE